MQQSLYYVALDIWPQNKEIAQHKNVLCCAKSGKNEVCDTKRHEQWKEGDIMTTTSYDPQVKVWRWGKEIPRESSFKCSGGKKIKLKMFLMQLIYESVAASLNEQRTQPSTMGIKILKICA